jgi:hypothetical protein
MVDNMSSMLKLNAFELCLLVEVCLKRGSEEHKNRARSLGNILIEKQKNFESYNSYYKDGNIR